MKFDINAARSAGYSDDEIADYLAKENNFDLGGALKSGYSASEVVDFLTAPKGGKQDLPADVSPSEGRSATPMGQADPRLVDTRGVIQRVADYLKPAPKSVMEGYQPSPEELQAERDRRLSYGAGPISSQTAAQADLVRSGMAKTDSPTVKKVAKAMDEQGTRSIGDLVSAAKNPVNERAAREAKADEFRTPGEWAVDTLSNLSQGAVGLVQMPINIIAPSSDVAETLRETQKELQAAESDVLRANRERLKERVLNEDGFFDRYVATVKELVTNPTLTISEAAKQVPNFLGVVAAARAGGALLGGSVAAAGRVSPTLALSEAISGNAIQTAARAAGTTAGGAGASMVMAGGDAAGDVYETLTSKDPQVLAAWQQNPDYIALRDKKIANGMDRNDAAQQAIEELATTKARMAALITAPLGLLGYMGAEAAVASKGLGRVTAEALTAKGMAKTATKDLVGEQLEEGGTQLGSNVVKQTVTPQQSLTEGVPEAMGTALVTSAPFTALGLRSQYKEAMQGLPTDAGAERAATYLLDPNSYDPALIDANQTQRKAGDVGPSAPARTQSLNFTEPDSATAQAGLTPIVVPVPTNTETTNVGTSGIANPAVAGSGQLSGDLGGAGLGNAGLAGVDALRGAGVSAAGLAPVGGTTAPLGSAAGQQPAGVALPRPLARATDADLLARTEAAIADQENNNAVVQPLNWAGRAGNGYLTQQAAEQGMATASVVLDNKETHDWRVEPMADGKFQIVGYPKETTLGTQTTQALQAETQGQEAVAGSSAVAASRASTAAPQLQDSGVQGLKFAPTATTEEFSVFQNAVAPDGVKIEPLRLDQMNNTHKLASLVSGLLGKTYTVARVVEGDPANLSNGMINKLGGRNIVVAEMTEDAPLFVAIHEAYHGLPAEKRKALNAQLLQLFRTEKKAEFLNEFKYTEETFEEEAPAFMVQVISKRADFWEELRTKMGNKEFGEVAKIILGSLNQLLRKVSGRYGQDFADTYITDIVKARDLLTTAYAEALRDQGLQPDAAVTGGVVRSNKSEIGAKLQQRIDTDFEGAAQEYAALKGTNGGRKLDTDIARELSPEYRADRTRSAEVHDAASDFIQREYENRIAKAEPLGEVVFMAGGGGSGKTSAEDLLTDVLDRSHTVYDGTLSSYDKAERNIQMALDAGQIVNVVYVYREPEEAFRNGVLTRAMRTGRTVPIYALVKGHAGSSEVIRKLQKRFGDDPNFDIIAVDNSRGPGAADVTDLQNITPVIKLGLKERLENAAREEFEAGRISEEVYRSTIKEDDSNAGAAAQGQAADAATAQADRGEVQGRSGSEREGDSVVRSNRSKKAGSYSYTVDDKGRITVAGDVDRIRFLTKAVAKGVATPDGDAVMFKAADADAAIKALKNEPKADPAIAANIQKQLNLSAEELASTSLEYQTGEPKDRAFVAPLKGGVPETVQFLEERRRSSGLRLLDIAKPEDQDTLAKLIAAETMAAIRSSGNALEWYDETIAKTLAMAAVKYPELGRDVNAQTAFRLGMAIASQGLNVENNLKLAMRQYEAFRNTGKFPEIGEGESAEAMSGNFRLANELMADMGPDLFRRFLATPFTIGELNSAGFDPGGELVDEEVLGSSVFGPKIGFGFYSNLNGNFEPVTMDMWFMRTMGRLTGYLRAFDAEKFSGQLKRFRDSFDQRGDDGVYADQFDADLIEAARTDQDSAIALARQVKKAHEKDFKANREAFDNKQRKKTSLVLAAETMVQSIDKPKDVPGNGTERRQMRQVVRKAVDLVEQAYGQRVPPAAMQALIWYPEQELYKALGVKLSVTSQDYAGATEKVLKEEGYDEQQLRTAAKSGARRVRQANARDERRAAQGDGQRAGRSGPLEGSERDEFVRSRYEQSQLEKERLNPTRKGVVFEVAPDPNNEELTNRWRSLDQAQRLDISARVAREIVPKVLAQFTSSGIITDQVGSYLEDTNPSFTVLLDKGDAVEIAKQLGFVLAQDSMMVVSPKAFKGGEQVGAIAIELGDKTPAEVDQIYQTLREIEVNGEKPIAGQSMANGVMTILNYSKVPNQQLAILVDQKLNKRYTVMTRDVFAAFPEKKEYDYGRETDDGRGSRADLRKGARALRTEATAALERELAGVSVRRSNRTGGPAELARGPSARPDAGTGRTVTGIHYGKAPGLSRLSGTAFGSGIKGAEQARLNEPGVDPRIKKRVYFYLTNNNADMPRPEIGLGSHVYRATLGNMFDMATASAEDKQRVQSLRKTRDENGFESAVLDAGFRGYVNREMQTAVVLNADVPVAYEGMADGSKMRDRVAERVAQAVTTRTEGDELVRKPSNDEMVGIIKARPALAEAAPSFKLQFGEARVKQSEAEAADRVLAEAGGSFRFAPQDVDSPFTVMRSNRVQMAPIEEPGEFDAKPGDQITVVRLASMAGLDNTNAASVKGLATYLSMVDDFDSAAGSEAAGSDTIFVYKVKVPEGGFGQFSRARGGRMLDSSSVGRMPAKYGGYWYSFPQGTEAELLGSIPLTVARETLNTTSEQEFKNRFDREMAEYEAGARSFKPFPFEGGTNNFDASGTVLGSTALQTALRDAGFEPDAGGVMFSRRAAPDTAEFKRWFGDSKVVDESGQPVVVYTGTSKDVDFFKFKVPKNGAWFTTDPASASSYAVENDSMDFKWEGGRPVAINTASRVMPVYLRIENPATLSDDDMQSMRYASNYKKTQGQIFDRLRAQGYDGVDMGDGVWVVIGSPNQIKSATGNSGEYSQKNDSIVKSNRTIKRQKLTGSQYSMESSSKIDQARIKLQDDGLRMKRVIEAVKAKGGKVTDAQNFYDANTLMPGRIQTAIDDFKADVIKPMLDKAAKYGIDLDELAMYSYAKHAKERNAYIASINKRMPDGGSGMSNDEADNILQMVSLAGDTSKFEDLHRMLMSITSATRQIMLSEGLITNDEFNQLEGAYENYIPLRGFENFDIDTGVARPGIGRGVNIRGAETIRAMGRKTKAGDLIENVIRDYERVIMRVERNDVGKVLLDFVLSNPDPDLWAVDVERTKPTFNKGLGTVQYTKAVEKGEDTIGVKVGGQQVYIKLADKELTRALRQAWKDETSGLERATMAVSGWWNNWMRAVLTKYNPAFAALNIPRDALWSGTMSALDDLGGKGLALYLKNYGKALMASSRQELGVSGTTNAIFGNPQVDRMFQEFRNAGGVTGGFYMRTLEDINKELRNELLLSGASARNPWEAIKSMPPFKLAQFTLKVLEFLGAASENATRFALYMTSREMGNSTTKAALLAKDGTTNFNRKGEWGGALNNMYLFYNAAVQGTAQLFKVLKNPKVQAAMAGVSGVGVMLALYGASAGGEDDDGEKYWDKIPGYVKERNLVIMLPPGGPLADGIERVGKRGRYVTIPVQYGFNIFPNLGYMIADMLRNAEDKRRGVTPTKAALHMTSVVLGSINPFGGAVDVTDGVQVLLAVSPTLTDLPIQIINERGTFGSPSAPGKSPWDKRPDSERMFVSQQDTVPARIAKAINELGGGNEAKAGNIMGMETSVTPGTIQTLISATTGGLGSFVEQVGTSVLAMTGDEKDLKANKIPFVNKFYGEVDESANIRSAAERMAQIRKLSDEVKAQQKVGIDPELKDDERKLMALAGMQETYSKQQALMRKAELEIIKDAKLTDAEKTLKRRQIQVERDKLATEVNRAYLQVAK